MKDFKDIMQEASSSDALPRLQELSDLLGPDIAKKVEGAEMKVKKQAAKKIWAKNKLNHLVDKLVRDVTNRKENCRRWKQGYVPDPTTYLNGERWEDEIQIDTPEQKKFTLPRNVDELMAFGTKMGMPARPGEDEFPYRQRLQAAL